jgi:hypothetical protein
VGKVQKVIYKGIQAAAPILIIAASDGKRFINLEIIVLTIISKLF